MADKTNRINSNSNLPFQAIGLLFLTLCLLISCPVKRELKSIFFEDVPLTNQTSTSQFSKQIASNVTAADFELACTKVVHSILDEVETNSFFQKFHFQSPAVLLIISLAGLYLLLVAATGNKTFHNAFSGGTLAAKIPLFLRFRQLVI